MAKVRVQIDGVQLARMADLHPEECFQLQKLLERQAPNVRMLRKEDVDRFMWLGEAPDDIAELLEAIERNDPLWASRTRTLFIGMTDASRN